MLGILEAEEGDQSLEIASVVRDLGRLLHMSGRWDKAQPRLLRALRVCDERRPVSADVHSTLHLLTLNLPKLKRWKETIPIARRLIALTEKLYGPNHAAAGDGRSVLARALAETGEFRESERLYRALLRGPRKASAWVGIGRVRLGQGRLDEAEMYVRKGISLKKGEAWFERGILADIVERRGRKEEAERMREAARSIWRQES